MSDKGKPVPIPAGRLSRITRLGGMTAGIAGNMAVNGIAQLGTGKRPKMQDLLLTPRNVTRLTEQLAKMRGAAMKMGQMLSMDSGEFLPPELVDILARLRDDAHFMPPAQLKKVLNSNWPEGWLRSFKKFDVHPIAAASIGQVHRAQLKDGRDLAIKVQYPGVADSIKSDVANVGLLLRASGLLPKGFEIAPYLTDVAAQLHAETDYALEAQHLNQFRTLLADDVRFALPEHVPEWSTGNILSMSSLEGHPIEDTATLPQDQRDHIAGTLIDLTLQELFTFGVMQSDPNFANYRYDPATGKIILLDFGATQVIPPATTALYRDLMPAGLEGVSAAMRECAIEIGFYGADTAPNHAAQIEEMMGMVFAALRAEGTFDFGDNALSQELQRKGMALANDGFVPPPLPIEVLFLQRKFGGVFLLANKLRARVDIRALMERHF